MKNVRGTSDTVPFLVFAVLVTGAIGGLVLVAPPTMSNATANTAPESNTSRYETPPSQWHSPPKTVIEQGSGVESADYIIFKDDQGNVYAKSGDSGKIAYSSTNASEVIQWAENNLGSFGGKIFIREGEYHLPEPVVIDRSGVRIEGTMMGWPTPYKYGTMLDSTENAIHLRGTPQDTQLFAKIDHIVFNTGERGIVFEEADGNQLQDVQISHCTFHSLSEAIGGPGPLDHVWIQNSWIESNGTGIHLDQGHDVYITNNMFWNNTTAIKVRTADRLLVTGNRAESDENFLVITGNSVGGQILNNRFYGLENYGIVAGGGKNYTISQNILDGEGSTIKFFLADGTLENFKIESNTMVNLSTVPAIDLGGQDIILHNNTGYRRHSRTTFPRPRTGIKINSNLTCGRQTRSDIDNGVLRATPFFLPQRATLDTITVDVDGAGGTDAEIRLGLYSSNGNCYPDSLIKDGAVAADTAGFKDLTIGENLEPGIYWVAINTNDNTIDISAPDKASTMILGEDPEFDIGWSISQSYGSLPDSFPSGASTDYAVPRAIYEVSKWL